MPVLITTTTIALILAGGKGKNRGSFLNPASVRKYLEKLPKSETREQALEIADEFVRIGEEYAETVKTALDVYAAHAAQWNVSADSLIEKMTPLDAAFARLLNEVLRIRQSLLDTLSPDQWDKVFD